MSFLATPHFEMESYPEMQAQSEYRSAYMTIISFLKFVDTGKCFTEKFLKDRFSHRLHYRVILEEMIAQSILKRSHEGNYVLNLQTATSSRNDDSRYLYY